MELSRLEYWISKTISVSTFNLRLTKLLGKFSIV